MNGVDKIKTLYSDMPYTMASRFWKVLEPRYVWFEATDMCNSRCKYCNIHTKKPTPNPLSPGEINKILSDSLFRNVIYVINSGGECTVRSDFKDILFAEHEALPDAMLNISTNALLPDKTISIVKEAVEAGIRIDVGISLDGIGKDHDEIRGVPGNFGKVVQLLDGLKGLPVDVSLGATLDGRHIKANMQAKEFTEGRGLTWLFHWFNVSSFYDNQSLQGADIEGMKKAVASLKPNYYHKLWLDYLDGKMPKFKCYALSTFCVIKCNGDVAPCLSLWNDVIGNMRTSPPKEVWYGEKADKVREKIRNCEGCLNSWSYGWSLHSDWVTNGIPYLVHKWRYG